MPGQPAGQIQQIQEFSSGGLAGVWAPQNTREAIWDAMQRKETFATSGPMIKVRFFGGFDYAADDVNSADFVKLAYAKGVPMGGDLKPGAGKAPTFLVMALQGPEERQPRPHPDRQGLARRGGQAAREDLRRGLVGRAQDSAPTASCLRSATRSI